MSINTCTWIWHRSKRQLQPSRSRRAQSPKIETKNNDDKFNMIIINHDNDQMLIRMTDNGEYQWWWLLERQRRRHPEAQRSWHKWGRCTVLRCQKIHQYIWGQNMKILIMSHISRYMRSKTWNIIPQKLHKPNSTFFSFLFVCLCICLFVYWFQATW